MRMGPVAHVRSSLFLCVGGCGSCECFFHCARQCPPRCTAQKMHSAQIAYLHAQCKLPGGPPTHKDGEVILCACHVQTLRLFPSGAGGFVSVTVAACEQLYLLSLYHSFPDLWMAPFCMWSGRQLL